MEARHNRPQQFSSVPPFPNSPPLPCRHASHVPASRQHSSPGTDESLPWWQGCAKKYVVLCLSCGGLSILLGIIFIVIYFILRSYTSSLQFFETIPTYVPAVVLVITGLMVMCFAKRRNRYAYLIKLAGGCCLICALLCVVITVTTTVVHMNRLQTLHECVYIPKAKTCTCVSAIVDSSAQDGTHRFIFNNTPNCEVVHGSLSVCLRVLFGLSVVGILICIFSSMLVYQLLTHEKKKVYLEQLELRRRFLHRQRTHSGYCNYCEDPWQLWEMLNYGTVHQPPEETTNTRPSNGGRRWNWWPWNARLRPGGTTERNVGNGLARCHSGNNAPGDFPATPPGGSNDRANNVYGNRGMQPARFGPRPTGRQCHRRTRSNDGVFHHLHFGVPHYAQAPFLTGEVPRYLWGPPPPYSHPPSVENVSVAEPQDNPYGSEGIETSDHLSTHSSKKSTPPSGRHFLYHSFASDGITLTIGSGFPADVDGRNEGNQKVEEGSCVVQVHVPCLVSEKREVVFNTLPARSCKKKEQNPFKSLSNIPLCLSRKLSGLRNDGTLSLIETCYEVNEMCNCSLEDLPYFRGSRMFVRHPSGTLSEEDPDSQENSSSAVTTPTTQSSLDFPATILELPSDFRSSIVVATSPSTPVTENVLSTDMVYAQSMPNLSVSNSPTACTLYRVPSGGDTSTSQDFADFELDEDGSLFGIASPERDLTSPTSPIEEEESARFNFDDGTEVPPSLSRVILRDDEKPLRHRAGDCQVHCDNRQISSERPVVVVIKNV